MSGSLPIVFGQLAAEQIRIANDWWRANRPKAPHAFSEDLTQATALLALQPHLGARARNLVLAGVRRVHLARIRYDLYYRVIQEHSRPSRSSRCGIQAAAINPPSESSPTKCPFGEDR